MADNQGHFSVVWPRSELAAGDKGGYAPRPASLADKRIAQIWDFVFRGDEIHSALMEELSSRISGLEFIHWREFGNIHGPQERKIVADLPQRLRDREIDAVIVGIGA